MAQTPTPNTRTTFNVGGKSFDLSEFRGKTAAEIAAANAKGEELYNALPDASKREADEVAKFVGNYKQLITLTGEAGGKETMERYWQWVEAGGKAGKDGANELMNKIDGVVSEHVSKNMPLYRQRQTVGTFFDFAAGLINGATNAPGALLTGGTGVGSTFIGQFGGNNISPQQAKTFGALYAGMLLDERTRNETLPVIDWPWSKEGSQVFNADNASSGLTATLRFIGQLCKNIWASIVDGKEFQWPDFGDLLGEEKFRRENKKILTRIDTNGNVAGAKQTQEITQALQGGITSDTKGRLQDVTASAQGLQIKPVVDQSGKPVTAVGKAVDEAKAGLSAPAGASPAQQTGHALGSGIGIAGIAGASVVALANTGNIARGIHKGYTETMHNAPLERAAEFDKKSAALSKGFSIFSPSTWGSEKLREGRMDVRAAQWHEEMKTAQSRMGTTDKAAVRERYESVKTAQEKGVFRRASSIVVETVKHPIEAVGHAAGWVSDKFATTSATVAKDTATLAGDAKAIASGVNPALEGVGKTATRLTSLARFAPRGAGIVGTALGAVDDTLEGIDANRNNDGRGVVKSTGRVVGGVAGGIVGGAASAAAAGAAIGVWFGGVGAVPGAIIGGAVGLVGAGIGGWVGAGAGGITANYVAGDFVHNNFYRDAAPSNTKPQIQVQNNSGAAGPADPGLAQAGVDYTRQAEAQAQALAAKKPGVNFAFRAMPQTAIGAVAPHTAPAPTGNHVAATPQPVLSQ